MPNSNKYPRKNRKNTPSHFRLLRSTGSLDLLAPISKAGVPPMYGIDIKIMNRRLPAGLILAMIEGSNIEANKIARANLINPEHYAKLLPAEHSAEERVR